MRRSPKEGQRISLKKAKRSKKPLFSSWKRFSRVLTALLLFGVIGAYLVHIGTANLPDNTVVIGDGNSISPNDYSNLKVNPGSGKVNIYIEVPPTPAGVSQTHFSLFLFVHLRALEFSCASGYSCHFKAREFSMPGLHNSIYDYDPENGSEVNFCVPLQSTDAGRGFVIGELSFDPATAIHKDFGADWRQDFYSASVFASGPCPADQAGEWLGSIESKNGTAYHSIGVKADWGIGSNGDGEGDNGLGNGSGGEGTGTDGEGEGTGGSGGTGQGPGGGINGGSSAKKQSNKPHPLPASSAQGIASSSEIEPSPFFDGKEFAPGSDADSNDNAFSSTGRKIVRNWYWIVGIGVLGGLAGFGYWRWRQTKSLLG